MGTKRSRLPAVAAVTLLCTAVAACGGGGTDDATNEDTASVEASALTDGGCISPDDPLVEAAQDEGSVVLSGPPDQNVRQQLPAAFEEMYGIQLDYRGGRGSEIAAKLESERAAGLYTQDVFMGGGDTITNVYHKNGWLISLEDALPEKLLTETEWVRGEVPWLDPEKRILKLSEYASMPYVINTDLVDAADVPGWMDLVDPRWRGKIVMGDPRTSGGGANDVGMFSELPEYGDEFIHKLYVDQEPVFLDDDRQMVDSLAQGKYAIGTSIGQAEVDRAIAEGLPLEVIVPEEGPLQVTSGFGLVAIADKAPHPHAAKLLATWLLCKDGNTVWNHAYGSVSPRSDVPVSDRVGEYQIVQPDMEYFDTYSWEFLTEGKAAAKEKIEEVLG